MPEECRLADFSRCEEAWLASIAASHLCWCDCQDYRNHIPGWRELFGVFEEGDGQDGGGGDTAEENIDAAISILEKDVADSAAE